MQTGLCSSERAAICNAELEVAARTVFRTLQAFAASTHSEQPLRLVVQVATPDTAAMNRDLAHYATSKLQGDWSALAFTKSLTREMLQSLIPRFEKLDPLVRVRLLLAALMLPPAQREELLPELQARARTGRGSSAELEAPGATL